MKPKVYRKTKAVQGSDIANFKPTEAGGPVAGIIIGPESSVRPLTTNASADQGNAKGILISPGSAPNPKEPAYISGRRGLQ